MHELAPCRWCPAYARGVDWLQAFYVLRVVAPRVLTIAFVLGMFVARDQTTAIVLRVIYADAAVMTNRLERAVQPRAGLVDDPGRTHAAR
jgi:hypothetical protein